MRNRYASLLGISLALASSAVAALDWIECNTCTQSDAASSAIVGVAPFQKVVINASQRWALKFDVRRVGTGPGCIEMRGLGAGAREGKECIYANVATVTELSPDEARFAEAVFDYYKVTNGTYKTQLQVDGNQLGLSGCPDSMCVNPSRSAHDVVRNFVVQNEVRQAVRAQLDALSAFGHIIDCIAGAANIVWLGGNMDISIVVVFSDGSLVVFQFAESNGNQGVLTHSQDPLGLPILTPANASGFVGSWVYPHNFQAGDFIENALRQGIHIYGPGGGGYGPGVTCIFDPVTQQTMCRRSGGG